MAKTYLDLEGLNQFWNSVKEYYKDTTAQAGNALQGLTLVGGGAVKIDEGRLATLDLSEFAKSSDLAAVFKFKGTLANMDDLNAIENPTIGDVYHLESDSAEYVYTENGWEALGGLISFDGYTKAETDSKVKEIEAAIDLKADKATVAETASSVADLKVKLSDETKARQTADAQEKKEREAAFDSITSIESLEISKLFKGKTVTSTTELSNAIAEVKDGDIITINSAEPVVLESRIKVPAMENGGTVTLEIAKGTIVSLDSAKDRLLQIGEWDTDKHVKVELVGDGILETTNVENTNPTVWVANNSELIINGPTITTKSRVFPYAIYTAGDDPNCNITIKSGTFNGGMYLASGGTTNIEGGEFNLEDKVFSVKSGTLNISGGEFTSSASENGGGWAHHNSGSVNAGGVITIEACNYGGFGKEKPIVNITGGTFNAIQPSESDTNYKVYDILVIPYGDESNKATMDGTTVPYQLADRVTGHIYIKGGAEEGKPTDGWYYFNDGNTQRIVP